jgi:hypothetical protein
MRNMLSRCVLSILIGGVISAFALAREGPGIRRERRPEPVGPRPWENDVGVFRVLPEGAPERLATFERAGVPAIARLKDGRLIAAHQHFPERPSPDFDKVAVHFSSDDGRTWTGPEVIQVNGLPEGMRFPFDPTLVPLADGRVRLYFTSVQRGPQREPSPPAIYSAISKDGVHYEFEPGIRFGVADRSVIDCAVVVHDGRFHLYSPDNGAGPHPDPARSVRGRAYHAGSDDGLTFRRLDDVNHPEGGNWLGCAQSDGKVIRFFGTGRGIWTATSEDGAVWKPGRTLSVPGADPGVVALEDGTFIVVATTAPRPGTTRENPRPR